MTGRRGFPLALINIALCWVTAAFSLYGHLGEAAAIYARHDSGDVRGDLSVYAHPDSRCRADPDDYAGAVVDAAIAGAGGTAALFLVSDFVYQPGLRAAAGGAGRGGVSGCDRWDPILRLRDRPHCESLCDGCVR